MSPPVHGFDFPRDSAVPPVLFGNAERFGDARRRFRTSFVPRLELPPAVMPPAAVLPTAPLLSGEELECVICYCVYSRSERIPRVLHCRHTFCSVCLEKLASLRGVVRTVSCPLCRWITCTNASLSLPGALWVNTDIWDRISDEELHDKDPDLDLQELKKHKPSSKQSLFMSTLHKVFSCVLQHHAC